MGLSQPAVHRTIMALDVEGYGDLRRTNVHKSVIREGMYGALDEALSIAGVPLSACERTDLGDGILILVGPEQPKTPFVEIVPTVIADTLAGHNATHLSEERIRVRVVLHAGEIFYDQHGLAAGAVVHAYRLLEAPPLKAALAESPGVVALVVSAWFFEEVVRNSARVDAATFRARRIDVKETVTIGWISLPDAPFPSDSDQLTTLAAGNVTLVPRQLPAGPWSFIGRRDEVAALDAVLDRVAEAGGAAVVSTVAGVGGIGKTWLALHWAHRNTDRFPDGQLFVDLRGFGPSSEILSADSAMRGFLDALGVDVARLPADLDARAARYRSLLADKRMLIVIDNARDFDHVVPLLPGGSTCMVIVTCRIWPVQLVTGYGAYPLLLDALPPEEAHDLLAARIGLERLTAEPEAVQELIASCAGLPLALSIVAGRALAHPAFPLASLAAELRSASTRLDTLDGEMSETGVSDVLSWSCGALGREQQQAFELLGLAPGPEIGVVAASHLTGLDVARVGSVLQALVSSSLLQEYEPARFRMHELVRLYAIGRARQLRAGEESSKMIRRIIHYYLYVSYVADHVLDPDSQPIEPLPAKPEGEVPDVASREAAVEWFATEHANLLAAQQVASDNGWHHEVWQLAWSLHTYHWLRGHLRDDVDMWRTALVSAERLGTALPRAICHQMLGHACSRHGQHSEALRHLETAIALADETGIPANVAATHHAAAHVYGRTEDFLAALEHAQQALRLYRLIGAPLREAWALNMVGAFAGRVDQEELARRSCDEALALFRRQRYQAGEAAALDGLGQLAAQAGDTHAALKHYEDALALRRSMGNTYAEAETLRRLGDCLIESGRGVEAKAAWREAELLFLAQNRTVEAEQVRSRLAGLG